MHSKKRPIEVVDLLTPKKRVPLQRIPKNELPDLNVKSVAAKTLPLQVLYEMTLQVQDENAMSFHAVAVKSMEQPLIEVPLKLRLKKECTDAVPSSAFPLKLPLKEEAIDAVPLNAVPMNLPTDEVPSDASPFMQGDRKTMT